MAKSTTERKGRIDKKEVYDVVEEALKEVAEQAEAVKAYREHPKTTAEEFLTGRN